LEGFGVVSERAVWVVSGAAGLAPDARGGCAYDPDAMTKKHRKKTMNVEGVGVTEQTLTRPIDWAQLYGNANPVEIEIGCGKGTFITDQARKFPGVNFFGIEWAAWFYRYTADRLRRHGCVNARAMRIDAALFVDEYVPDASVSVLHIYFPDPWPKQKHHRRRLINPAFMKKVERILVPGGKLSVVTDHLNYWQAIEPAVRGSGLKVIEFDKPSSAGEGETVGTNFERKYIREGRPFYAIAAVRV
jgi:tRNA (guanine-N7-)-methyltransferase